MKDEPTIPGTTLIPFERTKLDDQVRINDMIVFNNHLFVATDKGLYEYDQTKGVLKPVILQDN